MVVIGVWEVLGMGMLGGGDLVGLRFFSLLSSFVR